MNLVEKLNLIRKENNIEKETKYIDGYDKYYTVSKTGEVISYKQKKPRKMKPSLHRDGYHRVTLYANHNHRLTTIHRLVLQAFKKKPRGKDYANHIDGDKLNNHIDNLEWCTRSENQTHMWAMGLISIKRGTDIPCSFCGDNVYRVESAIKASKHKVFYCNVKCKAEGQKKESI